MAEGKDFDCKDDDVSMAEESSRKRKKLQVSKDNHQWISACNSSASASVSAARVLPLPSDIYHGIFSRLPVNTLLRFRCVCKAWCHVIDDPHLATTQRFNNTNTTTGFVSVLFIDQPWDSDSDNTSERVYFRSLEIDQNMICKTLAIQAFPLPHPKATPLFHCVLNGLICFSIPVSEPPNHDGICDVYLCNPLKVKDTIKLPPPTPAAFFAYTNYGFGFDSTTNTYKIVRVYHENLLGSSSLYQKVEVLTLGTKTWRTLESVNNTEYNVYCAAIYAPNDGSLYWRKVQSTGMVTFDLANEVFSMTPMPGPYVESYGLFILHGCLALFDNHLNFGDTWILKGGKEKKKPADWVMMYKLKDPLFGINSFISVLGMWDEDHLLFEDSNCNLTWCNTKTNQWGRFSITDMLAQNRQAVGFQTSLILPSNLI